MATAVQSPVIIRHFYDIVERNIHHEYVKMSQYEGKVVVIVNTATFADNASSAFKQMNDLQYKFGSKLAILGFPCNQFGGKENATGEEILRVMKHFRPGGNFEPAFEMFDRVEVNGRDACALYTFLRRCLPLPSDDLHSFVDNPHDIRWSPVCRDDVADNFEKFILTPRGKPYRRYGKAFQIVKLHMDVEMLLQTSPDSME